MGRSEDGELEWILGNRQLISVFFIVVVMLGVFFTLGYIAGKNSVSPDVVAAARKSDPLIVDPATARREPYSGTLPAEPKPAPAEAIKPSDSKAVFIDPLEGKKKAADPPKTAAKQPEQAPPPKKEEKPAPVGQRVAIPPTTTPAAPSTPAGTGQQYLQVVASTRPDCEIIADVLKRKGLPATIAPGPSEAVFRVLVGPLADAAAISKARTELEAAGFQKPYLRKY